MSNFHKIKSFAAVAPVLFSDISNPSVDKLYFTRLILEGYPDACPVLLPLIDEFQSVILKFIENKKDLEMSKQFQHIQNLLYQSIISLIDIPLIDISSYINESPIDTDRKSTSAQWDDALSTFGCVVYI